MSFRNERSNSKNSDDNKSSTNVSFELSDFRIDKCIDTTTKKEYSNANQNK